MLCTLSVPGIHKLNSDCYILNIHRDFEVPGQIKLLEEKRVNFTLYSPV